MQHRARRKEKRRLRRRQQALAGQRQQRAGFLLAGKCHSNRVRCATMQSA